jgi:hypothetical protein
MSGLLASTYKILKRLALLKFVKKNSYAADMPYTPY